MIDIGNKTVYMGGAIPEEKGTYGSGLELLDKLESFNLNFISGGVTPEEWTTVYGISPLWLPNAKANSLKYVKAFGGTEQSGTPTPDAPIDIVSNNGAIKCSPNLCDVKADNVVVGKYISAQGVLSDSENNFTYIKYIPVTPNTIYTLSFSSPLYFASVSEYSTADDSGFVIRKNVQSSTNTPPFDLTNITITTGATTNYIRWGSNMYRSVALTLADVLAVNYMLVQGSAQPYRPYGQIYTDGIVETIEDTIGNTATTGMLLKIGDYQDVQSVLDGAVTRNVGVKVLDGTEEWQQQGTRFVYTDNATDRLAGAFGGFCNYFPLKEFDVYETDTCIMWLGNSIHIVSFQSTVADFKAWLQQQYASGTPLIMVYAKPLPTTESVTGQKLQVQAGDNTLEITQASLTGLMLEAKYKTLSEPIDWEKPADWPDIRAFAEPNSVYFLVGHKADYTQYAKFSVAASVSTTGNTYDVFVDGVKIATTQSGTATVLDWQTLALASGFDVTYPTALRTHIVRVTPSVSTDTITQIANKAVSGQTEQGMLWAHFTADNPMNLQRFTGASNNLNLLLEAITSQSGVLKFVATGSGWLLSYAHNIKTVPVLDCNGTSAYFNYIGANQTKLKKIVIKNASNVENADGAFISSTNLEQIDFQNVDTSRNTIFSAMFNGCRSLKRIPVMSYDSAVQMGNFIVNTVALEDTYLDLSQSSNLKQIGCYGTNSSNFVSGLKGLTVSSSAPFDGASPQINVSYTGMDRAALVTLFNSLPTVSASQVCNVTGCTGAADLTASDLAIATGKGWTITR